MTEKLRDAFGSLVAHEPPMRLDVPRVVANGRRRRRRQRWIVSASVAASVISVLGIGIGIGAATATRPPPDRGSGVTADNASGSPPVSTSSPPTWGDGDEGLVDPGFEADPVSWDVFGPATTLTAVQTVHGGQRAVRIVGTAPGRNVAGATSRPVRVITEAGARYTASCWVRATGPLDAYVQVQEYTITWGRAGDPAKSARFTLTDPAVWYRISVTYTAAHTGNQLPLTVFGSDMTNGGAALLADDCSLRRG